MPPRIDISGRRFGRLLVLHDDVPKKNGSIAWFCLCDCGNHTIVKSNHLRNGLIVSCGCRLEEIKKEFVVKFRHDNTTHGMTHTRIYAIWQGMLERCYKTYSVAYKYYGLTGIYVCERWHNFENFLLDMGIPEDNMTLDRFPDVHGPYAPWNCRWATYMQQNRNKDNNKYLTLNGERKLAAEWSEILGIKYSTIFSRIWRGWSDEEILTTPVHLSNRWPSPTSTQ